ncbi:hypothetical protein BDK51DRAFT_29130 [Blyttiomyces helicus]|uniref:Reelin domain-containing protein n=1 Tax=Blyttiomyces helicus TaxID=388810 RepID=A0A4P9WIF7_9FUNG|nr:hypothetical protein BDK51DRAFT_29130 [Blyttiomyces helicus]|eukprot:RKO92651.1 hypothetical protein BDK51DRAFT_29130 [Blyttiomyces helicus]
MLLNLATLALAATSAFAHSAYPGVCTGAPADVSSVSSAGSMGILLTSTAYAVAPPTGFTGYSAGTPVTVQVTGPGSFTGLLLYAAVGIANTTHLGTWTAPSGYQVMDAFNCASYGAGATLGHSSSAAKTLPASFTWTPPTGSGNVSFYGILVTASSGFEVLSSSSATVGTGTGTGTGTTTTTTAAAGATATGGSAAVGAPAPGLGGFLVGLAAVVGSMF